MLVMAIPPPSDKMYKMFKKLWPQLELGGTHYDDGDDILFNNEIVSSDLFLSGKGPLLPLTSVSQCSRRAEGHSQNRHRRGVGQSLG